MTNRLLAFVALAWAMTAPLNASASPWRYETGLRPPSLVDSPVSVDGVEHPWLSWRGIELGLIADTFITYRAAQRQSQWFHEFELSRLQVTGYASYQGLAGVNLTVDTVRSSGSRSYVGVDGDSILPRAKWAFAEVTPLRHWLSLRGGIIPDLLLQYVESSWAFRAQGPVGLERDAMFTPGDLGASIEGALPKQYGSVALSYGNGEGTHLREQNNGKNITAAVRIAPLGARLPQLLVHLLYRDGSLGAGQAADSRLSGGVTYAGRRLGAGAIGTWALGYLGVGARDAAHLTIWGRGELPRRFYLFGRSDLLWSDATDASALQLRIIAGAAYALPALVRVLVGYEGTLAFGATAAQVPSVQEHALLVQLEGRL